MVRVTCALIEQDGKVLVAQRPEGKALAGKWEFPGGKIDPGESAEACLEREIREELGCSIRLRQPLSPVIHAYPNGSIELVPFICVIATGEPQALEHAAIDWMEPAAIQGMDLAAADEPILVEYLQLLDDPHGAS